MHIFELSDDILKDLIFDHLLVEATNRQYDSTFFSFKWNEDKSILIHEDVDFVVDGNSCWEDSKQTTKHTSAYYFNDNEIGEFFTSFLIPDYIIQQRYEDNICEEYIKYLDNYKNFYDYHCFVDEDTRQENEDYYYNYDRVRTLSININDILIHLKSLNVAKDLNELKSIFHNIDNDKLETIVNFNTLDNKFPKKDISSKRMKI